MSGKDFSARPPMGWNSYDYYDTTVTEAEVKANAAYMAEHLRDCGWEYVVVDIQWYARRPNARRKEYQYLPFGELSMDEYSRLVPDPERFPSSADGAGFKPLADYIHSLGLKFGIHIMRGIPRAAAHGRGRIKNCGLTADEIADPSSICRWNPDMYGVRDGPEGQAYYDSLLELYASWGVDYIKCDDICNTDNWEQASWRAYAGRHEIEMLHRAIGKCGRPVVLSLSPGPALIDKAWHYARYANMWRITDDMWDRWDHVKAMFARCELWQNHVRPGCWPDCDMLPLGRIGKGFGEERDTRLTRDEQRTLMTLWCVFGSPLMIGAELTRLDGWTRSLLTNRRVLELLDGERTRRQLCRDEEKAVWASRAPAGGEFCVAIFNLSDGSREITVPLAELGAGGEVTGAEELWTGEKVSASGGSLTVRVPAHGCKLLQICEMGDANMDLKHTALGIELGSTRIKAVLIDRRHQPIASGDHVWENRLVNGVWTYSMEDIHTGLQDCYANLKRDVKDKYGVELTAVGAIGVSAMMHGYLPFDKDMQPLAEFRTWRNTMTGQAAAELTELFHFNIPQRWSVAHLYQAILNGEEHVSRLSHLTTLAGYVHWKLTGKKAVGVGEGSGIVPVAPDGRDYDPDMVQKFDALIAPRGFNWTLRNVLPDILPAGANGGYLTEEGARFLDPAGDLLPGVPVAPCEGDAGTGMTATNSVRAHTGNVSAGTSDFAMVVLDRPLGVHREIDMVTTPAGAPVAMVHCSNCTSDINAWVDLFGEFAGAIGAKVDKGELYTLLFQKALEGQPDCGGLLSYNYFSGEGVTDLDEGRPVFLRTPDAGLTLGNFMRTHLLSALATLKIGLDILTGEERVPIDKLYGHGGFFKTPGVGQRMLSAAAGVPVAVMETAGEGGPYGMALLAGYMLWREDGETLEDYLDNKVFAGAKSSVLTADERDVAGFTTFLERYKKALPVERLATEVLDA